MFRVGSKAALKEEPLFGTYGNQASVTGNAFSHRKEYAAVDGISGPILSFLVLLFPEILSFYLSYPMGSLNVTDLSEAAAYS